MPTNLMVDRQQNFAASSWSLHAPWPLTRYCYLVFAFYLIYLPFSGYNELLWDAQQYWDAVSRFFINKKNFSLLNYDFIWRGYVGPLLIMPVRVVCMVMGWNPIYGAKAIGLVWATLLFGFTIPELWRATTGQRLPANVWLLVVALSFIFWGDYFNYCLQDFPALTLLLLALVALARPGLLWVVCAGALLAMSLNIRPVYMVSIPGVLGWFWWQTRRRGGPAATPGWWLGAGLLLLLGIALVLTPQLLINYRHFQQLSPLVLMNKSQHMPFYLVQLNWGLAYQRYDTSTNPLHFGAMVYGDREGVRELAAQAKGYFESYGDFARYFLTHPIAGIGHYLRHLFNGLDVDYRAPYPAKIAAGHITTLQFINYNIVALGTVWLAYLGRRAFRQRNPSRYALLWLLVVLLVPVAIAIPTAIEVRFLIPLHLLLVAAAATALCSGQWLRLRVGTYVAIAVAIAAVTWGGVHLSTNTQQQLLPPDTHITDY